MICVIRFTVSNLLKLCASIDWRDTHTSTQAHKATSNTNTNKMKEKKSHIQINEKQMVHSELRWIEVGSKSKWMWKGYISDLSTFFFPSSYVCMHACVRACSSTFEHSLFSDIQFITAVLTLALHSTDI